MSERPRYICKPQPVASLLLLWLFSPLQRAIIAVEFQALLSTGGFGFLVHLVNAVLLAIVSMSNQLPHSQACGGEGKHVWGGTLGMAQLRLANQN